MNFRSCDIKGWFVITLRVHGNYNELNFMRSFYTLDASVVF